MAKSVKKLLKDEYHRLKKVFEKYMQTKKRTDVSQLVLQPVRHKKIEGYNLR